MIKPQAIALALLLGSFATLRAVTTVAVIQNDASAFNAVYSWTADESPSLQQIQTVVVGDFDDVGYVTFSLSGLADWNADMMLTSNVWPGLIDAGIPIDSSGFSISHQYEAFFSSSEFLPSSIGAWEFIADAGTHSVSVFGYASGVGHGVPDPAPVGLLVTAAFGVIALLKRRGGGGV